jgi:riboflavin transporter FmnP
MNTLLTIAAVLTLITTLIHLFGGGPTVAGPLLRSNIPDVPRYTNYYCWHLVSIMLAAMSIGFYIVARDPAEQTLGVFMTVLAAGFTIWSLALIAWKRQSFLQMPQWLLFLPIAICGAGGLLLA